MDISKTVTMLSCILCIILCALRTTSAAPSGGEKRKKDNNISATVLKLWPRMIGPCRTHAFVEVVYPPGCNSYTVENKFCGGLCQSIIYPAGEKWIQQCTVCKPTLKTMNITLDCPNDKKEKKKVRAVTVVQDCKCQRHPCTG